MLFEEIVFNVSHILAKSCSFNLDSTRESSHVEHEATIVVRLKDAAYEAQVMATCRRVLLKIRKHLELLLVGQIDECAILDPDLRHSSVVTKLVLLRTIELVVKLEKFWLFPIRDSLLLAIRDQAFAELRVLESA